MLWMKVNCHVIRECEWSALRVEAAKKNVAYKHTHNTKDQFSSMLFYEFHTVICIFHMYVALLYIWDHTQIDIRWELKTISFSTPNSFSVENCTKIYRWGKSPICVWLYFHFFHARFHFSPHPSSSTIISPTYNVTWYAILFSCSPKIKKFKFKIEISLVSLFSRYSVNFSFYRFQFSMYVDYAMMWVVFKIGQNERENMKKRWTHSSWDRHQLSP